ncbi:23S ribosomal RNA methyltransferase [Sodiomyces alkalinus F11]|uniref:rRNA methyltransferase 2, mitochondrial n=1 Tax=Sodiomyces alkalinus (strain CBS 110278 / VKM F-3762 / F11) TaxID=1314773 RepID=A0A3N2PJB2_SODAK|nr:23S ribosomal RNA methyltransferase [Sodiomyces alkalinus F11]ROT34621.1 23S ribosomal RNA methyltransferase [Sodiomyces alkalinus F11]
MPIATLSGCVTRPPWLGQFRPSSSKTRWKMRQGADHLARDAKIHGFKSRAAFKLLELDGKYRVFKKGQVVIDLVAYERTGPSGNVIGIDLIPAQPPKGVTTIQGNFLLPEVQRMVKDFLVSSPQRRRATAHEGDQTVAETGQEAPSKCPQSFEMMNTSGIAFHDHARSMDLCHAALHFASDTLKHGGHFICKYYQGPEDRAFEKLLKRLFTKVHREKPESSRKESKESYFVALHRLGSVRL